MKRIAMFSVHGYFDPVPRLGATDTGGQVVYVLELSKALAGQGYGVDIFTRGFEGKKQEEPVNQGVRVVRIPAGPDEFIPKEELYPYLDELTENTTKYIRDKKLEYEIFHSHYWDSGYVAMGLTRELGDKFFHTSHSLGAWKKEQFKDSGVDVKMYAFEERIEKEKTVFQAARGITATSHQEVERYKNYYGKDSDNIQVIPPGVDVKVFRTLDEGEKDLDTGLPRDYILAIARIDHNKGFDLLIHAFARIADKYPHIKLVIGGGSLSPKVPEVELKKQLVVLAGSYGLKERVLFTGYVSDDMMAPYYRGARLFLLPSRMEPFGMTAIESMACGTPVVVTSLGGIRDFLVDQQHAMVANPKDAGEFSRAMDKVLGDESFRQALIKEGLKIVYGQFTWDSIARQHLSFYDNSR